MKYLIFTKKIWDPKNKNFKALSHLIKNKINLSEIKKIKPNRIFFIHWSKIIDKKIFLNYECVQFHCSKLPKFKGGSPVQNQIIRGINKTKLSAFRINKNLDSGDICLSRNLSLTGKANDIYKRIENIALEEIKKSLLKPKLNYKKQIGKSSFYKRRSSKLSKIPLSIKNIKKLYDFIRMLDAESYPKSFLKFKNFKIEFFNAIKKRNKIYGNFEIKKK
tara:strand:- start:173 stop:829 length:657 start_codon:yes stop_codon:yes gene_type:complete